MRQRGSCDFAQDDRTVGEGEVAAMTGLPEMTALLAMQAQATLPCGRGWGGYSVPLAIASWWRLTNSWYVSIPRSCRIVFGTAASTSTARLRPASTAITTLRTGMPRISSYIGS